MGHRRGVRRTHCLVALALLAGCRDEQPTELTPSGVTAVPVDSTLPGELAEGESFFGFPVPRDMRVVTRMSDVAYARGVLDFEVVTNYARERLVPKRVDTGPNRTVFVVATLRDDTASVVEVEVVKRRADVELIVRDRRPKPPIQGLSEKEVLERSGLTRDGRPIDKMAE